MFIIETLENVVRKKVNKKRKKSTHNLITWDNSSDLTIFLSHLIKSYKWLYYVFVYKSTYIYAHDGTIAYKNTVRPHLMFCNLP